MTGAAQGNNELYIDPVAQQWLDGETLFDGVVPNADRYFEYIRRLKADVAQTGSSSGVRQLLMARHDRW
jgi:hypothetical protein